MGNTILRFASVAALARETAARDALNTYQDRSGPRWYNNETGAETLAFCDRGDDRLVAEAERLIEQLSASIELPDMAWQSDVCGAYPVVAEFLSGNPDCMRRRAACERELAPISIYVDVASSWQVTADMLQRRGVAILALVMGLSRVRPVDLSVVSTLGMQRGEGAHVVVAPINTRPIDLASACYALTSSGFSRRICLGIAKATGGHTGKWPDPAAVPAMLGVGASDLFIKNAHVDDAMLVNPVAWVQREIDRLVGAAS